MYNVKSEAATGGAYKKDVLTNFAKYTGKHLCRSSTKFREIFKGLFFAEHLQGTASLKWLYI